MCMELQEQVNLLWKRVAALEEKLKINPLSSSLEVEKNGGSRDAWVITKKMEAKERMAKELRDRHCSEVASGSLWDADFFREDYVKLRREIRALNEQLADL